MRQHFAILAVLLLSLQLFQNSGAEIRCNDVIKDLIPCVGYIRSGSGSPSSGCCSRISTLVSAVSAAADRRAACSCIQSAVLMIKPNVAAAQGLPGTCGISLPFTVSINLDCSKIN